MKTKATVIYHSADFDGLFCREIARKFLGDEANYVGWNHGDAPLEFPSGQTVYVLDLNPSCFNGVPLDDLVAGNLIWIDHHKSAIEEWPAKIAGYRIDGVAACRLAWQWFTHPTNPTPRRDPDGKALLPPKEEFSARKVAEPLAVRLAGEYDVWDKRDERAELFQHGLRSCDLSGYWPNLLRDDEETVANLLERGEALQYAKRQEDANIITSYGFTVFWEGLQFLACNAARFNSHLFTAGFNQDTHEALLGFVYDGKNDNWRVSLYHAPGKTAVDLSEIARKYGGGGHRGACGFTLTRLPWTPAKDTYRVARDFYRNYCVAVGGKAFNGDPLPSWEEFYNDPAKEKQVRAYLHAAEQL